MEIRRRTREAMGPRGPAEDVSLHQGPHAFLEEERVPLGALDQETPHPEQGRIVSEQARQQGLGALAPQRIDAELAIISPATPAMPVFGPVVDEKEHGSGWQALDGPYEEGLRLGVDPVQVLEDQQ